MGGGAAGQREERTVTQRGAVQLGPAAALRPARRQVERLGRRHSRRGLGHSRHPSSPASQAHTQPPGEAPTGRQRSRQELSEGRRAAARMLRSLHPHPRCPPRRKHATRAHAPKKHYAVRRGENWAATAPAATARRRLTEPPGSCAAEQSARVSMAPGYASQGEGSQHTSWSSPRTATASCRVETRVHVEARESLALLLYRYLEWARHALPLPFALGAPLARSAAMSASAARWFWGGKRVTFSKDKRGDGGEAVTSGGDAGLWVVNR